MVLLLSRDAASRRCSKIFLPCGPFVTLISNSAAERSLSAEETRILDELSRWAEKAATLAEIEREPRALRARFEDPSARLFPVALTYLVPKSMVR